MTEFIRRCRLPHAPVDLAHAKRALGFFDSMTITTTITTTTTHVGVLSESGLPSYAMAAEAFRRAGRMSRS